MHTNHILAQLISGWCRSLKNCHQPRIDENVLDVCPDGNNTPHDVPHLFNLSAKPTSLTVENLYGSHQKDVAIFLGLSTNDDDDDEIYTQDRRSTSLLNTMEA